LVMDFSPCNMGYRSKFLAFYVPALLACQIKH
jgi:hypothetical protein